MEKCAVCNKQTDKCCSLCRKLFYCKPQHQEVHWHMVHKFNCEGKQQKEQEDFRIYTNSNYQTENSAPPPQPSHEEEAKAFVELFEERLVMRKNVLGKYLAARESSAAPITHRELAKQCQDLVALSKKVTRSYAPTMTDALQQGFGLLANSFVVKLDELLDMVLLARCYYLAAMPQQLKELILAVGNESQSYPSHLGQEFVQAYRRFLGAASSVSELAGLDRVTEKIKAHYVRLCQRFEGIWEQSFCYYNMGVWYGRNTYYQKALKCFEHAVKLVASSNASRQILEGSTIFRGDSLYNMALCHQAAGQKDKATQTMQESYRLRVQGLGKSSLEASNCLLALASWTLNDKKFDSCLQFAMECLRIRKSNPAFARQLDEVHILIVRMYEQIHREKEQSERVGSHQGQYYERLLQNEDNYKTGEDQKESFTKRLLSSDKQLVKFKLVITPELANTLSSNQWVHVGQLIELVDHQMEREEAVRHILESNFSLALNQEQRDTFIKLNKIQS